MDCSASRGASMFGTGASTLLHALEDGVTNNILKFADDTKIFRRVQTRQKCHTLQGYLNIIIKWSEKWQMLFNQSIDMYYDQSSVDVVTLHRASEWKITLRNG